MPWGGWSVEGVAPPPDPGDYKASWAQGQGPEDGVESPGRSWGHWHVAERGQVWVGHTQLVVLASCVFLGGSRVWKAGTGPSLPALGTGLTHRAGRSS